MDVQAAAHVVALATAEEMRSNFMEYALMAAIVVGAYKLIPTIGKLSAFLAMLGGVILVGAVLINDGEGLEGLMNTVKGWIGL